jgi:hypothetical protein
MRAYYDFLVRYEELLISPELTDDKPGDGTILSLRGVSYAAEAEAGAVWTVARRKAGHHIVHLINLRDQSDVAWNSLRTPPGALENLELTIEGLPPVSGVLLLTPDTGKGKPVAVSWTQEANQVRVHVPRLLIWAVVVFQHLAE